MGGAILGTIFYGRLFIFYSRHPSRSSFFTVEACVCALMPTSPMGRRAVTSERQLPVEHRWSLHSSASEARVQPSLRARSFHAGVWAYFLVRCALTDAPASLA